MTQAVQDKAGLLAPLKADAPMSPGDHWGQGDLAGGVSFGNVQFEDIIFEDVEPE